MEFALHKQFPKHLEQEWNDLLSRSITHVPFLRFEYLETWWQTRGGGEWPEEAELAIVTAHRNGKLAGVAPLFAAVWESKKSLLLLGSIEISDYLDLIVPLGDLAEFTSGLFALLSDSGFPFEWDQIEFYNVLESSPALPFLESGSIACGWKYHLEPFRPALTIPLPGDWETYLAGIDKKQRHEIRRKMRRAYSGDVQVRWYLVENPTELDSSIETFLKLMSNDEGKRRFLTPPMRENFKQTMRCAFDAGCLFLAFLEIDGVKAAGYLNMDYQNQLWVYNSGMDASYIDFSPGWVLLGELLKWANENGRIAFDFMRGDEDYKFRFGAKARNVMRVTLTRT